ncbi:hypothetical protein RJ641_005994 [Dillenia turbinata]|uniref:Uncharacterized protein n=1 Tax=Dillenia turbinata TaxID=194707 RepID=A0AAN8VGV8_9MAGN
MKCEIGNVTDGDVFQLRARRFPTNSVSRKPVSLNPGDRKNFAAKEFDNTQSNPEVYEAIMIFCGSRYINFYLTHHELRSYSRISLEKAVNGAAVGCLVGYYLGQYDLTWLMFLLESTIVAAIQFNRVTSGLKMNLIVAIFIELYLCGLIYLLAGGLHSRVFKTIIWMRSLSMQKFSHKQGGVLKRKESNHERKNPDNVKRWNNNPNRESRPQQSPIEGQRRVGVGASQGTTIPWFISYAELLFGMVYKGILVVLSIVEVFEGNKSIFRLLSPVLFVLLHKPFGVSLALKEQLCPSGLVSVALVANCMEMESMNGGGVSLVNIIWTDCFVFRDTSMTNVGCWMAFWGGLLIVAYHLLPPLEKMGHLILGHSAASWIPLLLHFEEESHWVG